MVGFWRTQTIGTAVGLGVIEALPALEHEVAEQCGLQGDGARRLLRALGELGLTTQRDERWALTARGELLRADHPLTLSDAAVEYAGPFMLRSYARHDYAEVCSAIDLRGDERVIDAGGGLGVLAQRIVDSYPFAEVTVLERPEVVTMAPPISRVRWQSGSLFEPWGIEADAVLLSRVLHDWDDGEALQILRHARAALTRGGHLYVVEMLVPVEGVAGALCDLHLLMATGGRERSAEDFGRLLSAAGFELAGERRLPALPSVIVGVAT
jgi:hypothetical protein